MNRSPRFADSVVIYFNMNAGCAGDGALLSDAQLAHLRWYCEWTQERCRRVLVALPASHRPDSKRLLPKLSPFSVFWCGEPAPKDKLRANVIWLINGDRLPMIDWPAASAAVRRQAADVLVFGQPVHSPQGNYPESVVTDGDGQVLRFQRHYFDSAKFADRFNGRAAFLAIRGEQAAAVIDHVCSRGWGMESVGALTVRLQVRWSSHPCLLTGVLRGDTSVAKNDGRTAANHLDFAAENRAFTAATIRELRPPGGDSRETVRAPSNGAMPRGKSAALAAIEDFSSEPDHEDASFAAAKRVLDTTAAALGLLLLSPLMLLIAALVKMTSPGPVLFGHRRQGLGGREFRCWKFRSMRSDADQLQAELRAKNEVDGPQFKMSRDPRITPLGSVLRKTNLDELPQLINVLRGEMSLVGPRPSPDAENQYCPAWRKARLSVRPGISGLWQVFRNRDETASDFQEWIYYDVEYARHRCMGLDFFILLCTPVAVVAPSWARRFRLLLERRGICTHAEEMSAPATAPLPELDVLSPALAGAAAGGNGKHYDSATWHSS